MMGSKKCNKNKDSQTCWPATAAGPVVLLPVDEVHVLGVQWHLLQIDQFLAVPVTKHTTSFITSKTTQSVCMLGQLTQSDCNSM